MNILQDHSLLTYNTFGIEASSAYFTKATTLDELKEAVEFSRDKSLLVLGGGSNILFTRNFNGLTLHVGLPGIELIKEDMEHYYVQANSGENWHGLVMHCIEHDYAGIENLSLIPGNVGAAPMQNIGAYGVELKDVFYELKALHIPTLEVHTYGLKDCSFGYRTSVFKTTEKENYIILSVTLRLKKKPEFHTSYGAITQELEQMGVEGLSIKNISQAVINIRQSKLPDPGEIGNAGSFFKNPVISADLHKTLKNKYPDMPAYPQEDGSVKLAAGWLIDKAGWKGRTFDNYGIHKNQALVLVNYGNASGKAIYELSEEILQDIRQKFGIELEREVNIL